MNKRAIGVVGRIVTVAAVLALSALPAASAAGPYDGTYHGTLTGGSMNALSCAKNAPVQMTITDNQLEYHHFSNAVIKTPVAADGSFSGSAQNMRMNGSRSEMQVQTLSGRITGTAIQAETKMGGYCTYELALKKF